MGYQILNDSNSIFRKIFWISICADMRWNLCFIFRFDDFVIKNVKFISLLLYFEVNLSQNKVNTFINQTNVSRRKRHDYLINSTQLANHDWNNTFCRDNNRDLELAINIFYIDEIQYFLISIILILKSLSVKKLKMNIVLHVLKSIFYFPNRCSCDYNCNSSSAFVSLHFIACSYQNTFYYFTWHFNFMSIKNVLLIA